MERKNLVTMQTAKTDSALSSTGSEQQIGPRQNRVRGTQIRHLQRHTVNVGEPAAEASTCVQASVGSPSHVD